MHYLRERVHGKEYPAEKKHRCYEQGKVVIKAVDSRDDRGKQHGDRGKYQALQKGDRRYEHHPGRVHELKSRRNNQYDRTIDRM